MQLGYSLMDRQRKVTYRTGLLDPSNLTNQREIEFALLEFGAVLNRENYAGVLQDLFERQYIVLLILSGIHEIPLNQWILDDFPPKPNNFETSFVYSLLRELCNFFLLYSSSADVETASLLRRHDVYIRRGSEILTVLLKMTFTEEHTSERSPPPSPARKRAKATQREQKQARNLARESLSIDHGPFRALNLTVPVNRAEADCLSQSIWLRMRSILDVLLNGTRRPEVLTIIHTLIIPREEKDLAVSVQSFSAQSAVAEEPLPSPVSPQAKAKVSEQYPMAQSMRMIFYSEPPVDFGRWRFLLGSRAESDLRHWRRRDNRIYIIIKKKFQELSLGFFSADNQKRLCGPTTAVPVFEAKMTRDLRLVYSVDCTTDYDNQCEVQVLRVFGIFTHAQMDHRLWDCVSGFLSSRSKEYRERCLARCPHSEGLNTYLPTSFSESDAFQQEEPLEFNPSLPADEANQLHQIISLEKYVMLSKVFLESIESNTDANFPFEVSKNEGRIIECPHSCYVLGRSGTGKTTTMLFKMLLIEQAYQLSEERRQRPRQMFVTKSPALNMRVEELFMTYLTSLTIASPGDEPATRRNMNMSDGDIFHQEDADMEWLSDLPNKFSELEDRHFPLFITFDKLCNLIEGDIQTASAVGSSNAGQSPVSGRGLFGTVRSTTKKGKLVTYDRFMAEYWSRFGQSRFHPFVVFNEIIGVIAGSEGSLLSPDGCLDRDTYVNLSPRMYPVFASHRELVYGMFMLYLKRKRELDDYDSADRTHAIIRSMMNEPLALQKVSHLYVDEVQDNLLVDTLLLRLLCGNSDGLFWAGDTAQTISAGSSFRFNDLKAFLYRLQRTRLNQEMQMAPIGIREPKMFYLSANYRSHAGIVNCAHSVVEIISKYWKNSIDALPRERGNAHGAMPIFYTDVYPEFMREGHFVSRDRSLYGKIDLGADQCVLVRDEKAVEKLKREVGDARFRKLGNVLTLYQSKGLEFNDVLLYNFFHDSLVDNAWRLILNDVPHDRVGQPQLTAPHFDITRHATLCSELKCLYVAITRARNNLRIVDESGNGEPIRALWESRGHILSCRPGEESMDFAKPSNEEEWANRAKNFFDNCQWDLAKKAYEKAGRQQAASVADSYLKREWARRVPSEGRGKERGMAFKRAARAFKSCAQNAGDESTKTKYLKLSAGCWEEGNLIADAAEAYREGNFLSDAARLYRKLQNFQEIYNIITKSDKDLAATVPEAIRDATCLYLISKKFYAKAHKLFDTVEEEMAFLDHHSLHDAQVHLLLRLGRKREAADLLCSEGHTTEAIDLYVQDATYNDGSALKAKEIIMKNLWLLSPFGVTPVERKQMNELLKRAKMIPLMDGNDIDEMAMFQAILAGARNELSELAKSFLKRGNRHAALLCYDHYFERLPPMTEEDIQKIELDLQQFADYVHTLRYFLCLDNLAGDPRTGKLFGFRAGEAKGTIVLLKPNTVSDSSYLSGMDVPSRGKLELTQKDFLTRLQDCLKDRLKDRVTKENEILCKSQTFQRPHCVRHVVSKCWSFSCERRHISPDFPWLRRWISVHLLQIDIYHSISGIQYRKEFRAKQKFWLVKLYEALNPASHEFGPTSNMSATLAALPRRLVRVLIDWVKAVSFDLKYEQADFLTFAMQMADFAFSSNQKEAETHMRRCGFVTSPEFCGNFQVNSLQEMLMSWDQKYLCNLRMGIKFIGDVLQRQIPVNIHVFCSFIERICSNLIVCYHLQRKGHLHGVMLPRTWLRASLGAIDVKEAKRQNTSCFWDLLEPLERLLNVIYFPQLPGTFRYQLEPKVHNLETQGPIIRNLFISRICRVLGLLGSNKPVDRFQDRILSIFTSLRQNILHHELDLKFPNLHKGYFAAGTFRDVHFATRQSMPGAVFDEMIRVLYMELLRATGPKPTLRDVRDVVYSIHEELVPLLDRDPMQHSTPPHPIKHHGPPLGDEINEPDDDQELELGDWMDGDSQDLSPPDIPEGVYAGHSEQEEHAAKIIQRVWKRVLDRKREWMKEGLEARARCWFELYRKGLRPGMRSEHPQYYMYILGPLPNLQAALDSLMTALCKSKEFLRRRLGDNSEELEADGCSLGHINKAMKNLRHYQSHLSPESILHANFDVEELTKQVKDIFGVISDIGPLVEMPEDLQEALQTVDKAVLQEPKPPQRLSVPTPVAKERRPQLVIEDLQDYIQDAREDIYY